MAGTSGAIGARFAVVTASRRIWPWLDSGSIGAMLFKNESIRPGIRSWMPGAAPR